MLSLFTYLAFPVQYMRLGVRTYFIFGTISVLLVALFLVLIFLKDQRRRHQQHPQEFILDGPSGLPLFGFWPSLGAQPYRVLGELADIYGPLCSVFLGRQRVLVVNDRAVLDEILIHKSAIFSGIPRPTTLPIAGQGIGGDERESFLRQNSEINVVEFHQKFVREATSKLKSAVMETLIKNELESACEEIHGHRGEQVDFRSLLQRSWAAVLERLLLGSTREPDSAFATTLRLFRQRQEIAGRSGLCLAIPKWLRQWRTLANVTGYTQLMDIESEFQASCFRLTSAYEIDVESCSPSFMEMYLAERAKRQAVNEDDQSFNGEQLTRDTIVLLEHLNEPPWAATLWALLLISRYTEVQEKIYAELSALYSSGDVTPRWSDRHRLKYTWAALAEIQRIAPVVTLDTLPSNIAATSVSGFPVAKDSSLVANVWRINSDPTFWGDPQHFRPERFRPVPDEGASSEASNTQSRHPEHVLNYYQGPKSWVDNDVIVMHIFLSVVTLLLRFSFLPPEGELVCEDGFTLKPARGLLRALPR